MTHGELDLTFLNDLTPDEVTLAREMMMRNLKLRQNHIIEGVSALHDVDAAPILRGMLNDERSLSRQLTIAGALLKLNQDPIFVEVLHRAKASGERLFSGKHLHQVLWLDDERALDFLIDLLDGNDVNRTMPVWGRLRRIPFFGVALARFYFKCARDRMATSGVGALQQLNWLEVGVSMPRVYWRPPSYYRSRRSDPAFRASMVAAVRQVHARMKNGW